MAPHSKKGAKLRALIGFLDESGISDRPTVRKTWAPRGKTPLIKSAGGWKVRSITGSIICTPLGKKPKLYLRIASGTVRHPEFIRFLKHLRHHVHRRLILLVDRLSVHKSKAVQKFARSQQRWLSLEWFPAYAPELNPVEYLWSASKRKDFANTCSKTMPELDGRIHKSVRRIRRKPNILAGFLKASKLFK